MKIKLSYFILFIMLPLLISAQEQERDKQLWTGVTYKLDLNSDWRFEIEEQLRFSKIYGGLVVGFTEAGLRYEFTDNFDVKLQYRYEIITLARNEQRISVDLSYNMEKNDFPLSLKFRFRAQNSSVTFTGEQKPTLRGRIGLDYNLNSLVDPFAEYERFYDAREGGEFDKNRYTLGLEWTLSKWWELSSFYRYEQELNDSNPQHEHIVGVGFSYSMDWEDFKRN